MKFAIELILDENSQNILKNIWQELRNLGVQDKGINPNYYHITLAHVEIDESQVDLLIKTIKGFAEKQSKLSLTLNAVGSFMTDANILFFSPILTDTLKRYNKKLDILLNKRSMNNSIFCSPEKWFPHCTIVTKVKDEEYMKAFKYLKDNNVLPLSVVADRVCIFCHNPQRKEYALFNLKNKAYGCF